MINAFNLLAKALYLKAFFLFIGDTELKRRRGCVKMLAQLFFYAQSPDFPKPGLCYYLIFCNFRHYIFVMAKLHFRPYIPNQTVLFPQRIDENIAANDPVRIVNAVVDNLNLDNFKKLL